MVPLMIGARDMAFPRINAMSFWLIPLGGMTMYAGFLVPATTSCGAALPQWTWRGGLDRLRPAHRDATTASAGQDACGIVGPCHLLGVSSSARRHQLPSDESHNMCAKGMTWGTASTSRPWALEITAAPNSSSARSSTTYRLGDEPARTAGSATNLLRPGQRRERPALPVRVLVLLAPGQSTSRSVLPRSGSSARSTLRCSAPKADLRLQGDGRHRSPAIAVLQVHRVRAPACSLTGLPLVVQTFFAFTDSFVDRRPDRGEDLRRKLATMWGAGASNTTHAHALCVMASLLMFLIGGIDGGVYLGSLAVGPSRAWHLLGGGPHPLRALRRQCLPACSPLLLLVPEGAPGVSSTRSSAESFISGRCSSA